jgi:hypothetical protein
MTPLAEHPEPAGIIADIRQFAAMDLRADLRLRSDRLLLRILDSAALYTIVGGLKPMSGYMGSFIRRRILWTHFSEFRCVRRQLESIELERRILAGLFGKLPLFATVHGSPDSENQPSGAIYAFGMLANMATVASVVANRQPFFAPYLVTPSSHPLEVLLSVIRDPSPASARGLGYLMGYPEYAIDFWLESRAKERATGRKVARDYIRIPTYSKRSNFVWAVSRGHQERVEDREIKGRAAEIFASYCKHRRFYIGKGKPGAVALLHKLLGAWC